MNNQAATATQNVVVSIYPQGQPRRPELISTTAGSVTITSIHGSFERSDLDAGHSRAAHSQRHPDHFHPLIVPRSNRTIPGGWAAGFPAYSALSLSGSYPTKHRSAGGRVNSGVTAGQPGYDAGDDSAGASDHPPKNMMHTNNAIILVNGFPGDPAMGDVLTINIPGFSDLVVIPGGYLVCSCGDKFGPSPTTFSDVTPVIDWCNDHGKHHGWDGLQVIKFAEAGQQKLDDWLDPHD